MIANLIALLEKLGPDAALLIEYLVAHKDQIAGLVALLLTLFKVPTPPAGSQAQAREVSDGEFIDACKKAGASTGDAQELLAVLS